MAKWTTEELAQHKANFFARLEEEKPKAKRKRKTYSPTKLEKDVFISFTEMYIRANKGNIPYKEAKPKFNQTSHGNFLEDLLAEYCKAYGWFFGKVDVRGVWDAERKIYRTTKSTKGFPDVTIVGNGKTAFIEVKGKGDSLSDDQKRVHSAITSNGGYLYIFEGDQANKTPLREQLRDIHNYLTK